MSFGKSTTVAPFGKLSLIGIGRLGFPLLLALAKAGYDVCGCDSNSVLIECINFGSYESKEPGVVDLYKELYGRFTVTSHLSRALDHSNLILILVPTPTGVDQPYDTSILSRLFADINKIRPSPKSKHFIICCTVAPGYCDRVADALIPDCFDCAISYSPEFVAQGEVLTGFANASMALIGTKTDYDGTTRCEELEKIHQRISPKAKIQIMNRMEAEITKLSVNSFLSLKIAFANHISDLCDSLEAGVEPRKVLKAVGCDRRIGPHLLNPGFGFGGPCLPRDARALVLVENEHQMDSTFLSEIGKENDRHHQQIAKYLLRKKGPANPVELAFCTYKSPCTVDMIDSSPPIEVALHVKKLQPERIVILHDRKEVLDLVRQKYGTLFEYDERNRNSGAGATP